MRKEKKLTDRTPADPRASPERKLSCLLFPVLARTPVGALTSRPRTLYLHRPHQLFRKTSPFPKSFDGQTMSHSQGRAEALDVEGGKVYEEPRGAPVNQDTILPTYRNNGQGPSEQRSSSGSVSDDQKHDLKEAREVDLDATEPPHEERQSEKSAFTKKLDEHAHLKRPVIHALMVAFCLGESQERLSVATSR